MIYAHNRISVSHDQTSAGQGNVSDGPGWSSPQATFQNGPIVVTATTNYSADTISNVPGITFNTSAASTATFLASQFGAGEIASNATITGDSNSDTIAVTLGTGQILDASGLQLQSWSSSDKFVFTGAGNDSIIGTGGTNVYVLHGDQDTLTGGAGNDIFNMGDHFDFTDTINGGAGVNVLELSGDYTAPPVTITAAMLQNVGKIVLAATHGYDLTIDSGVVNSGKTMVIDGTSMTSGNNLTLDVSADTGGRYVVNLGGGYNIVDLNNQIDAVYAGSGQNFIYAEDGVIPVADKIVGAGTTVLTLSGDYSHGYAFGASTITGISDIDLVAGNSYRLITNDANLAAGKSMSVDGSQLGTTDSIYFDGSHETNGTFSFYAGAGRDTLIGGAGNDDFYFASGEKLTAADHVNGGGGNNNRLFLTGDYSAGVKFGATTVENIQSINLGAGYSYKFTTNDATVAAGQTLFVNGLNLDASHSLYFNGSAETNGSFNIIGGAGNDTLIGGKGNDVFNGGGGADLMISGGGADQFYYSYVSDSTSTSHDTIVGFDASIDSFVMVGSMALPGAIDATVTTGKQTSATFDADLSHALSASQLHAHDAVLYTPNSGNLAGHTFLVIDENGVAGYQAGQDLVIDITGATNLPHLSTGNFI
jgi:Ca2+-binding RTX toxin-like protein